MARRTFIADQFSEKDERIRRLEADLWTARYSLVNLMPENIARLLLNYHRCETESHFYSWQREVVDSIIDLAHPEPKISYLQDRAYCPLCRGGTSGPYESGFTLPEGLRRHLTDYGNVSQCPVTEAAFNLARDRLQETFVRSRELEKARITARREGETLYRTGPSSEPKLLDEGIWGSTPRGQEQIVVAEHRLRDLGFEIEKDANVVSYVFTIGKYRVLADLRKSERIDFVVYDTERKGRAPWGNERTFYLLDNWKKDLTEKFSSRLNQAVRELEEAGSKGRARRR